MFEPESTGPLESLQDFPELQAPRRPRRWWLNALLFLLTLLSTTIFGSAAVRSFEAGQALDLDGVWESYQRFAHGDASIWSGLYFSTPLLLILLTHELGHYVKCRMLRVDASLPYFLPSPTLFGTLGAFIRIRSPIYTRRGLFDIGIAGPIAGFIMLAPFLLAGVFLSRPVPPGLPDGSLEGPFVLGAPLILRLFEWLRFGAIDPARILLHPMALAGWVGLLATAMNLIPMGQLDGGHIVYALVGERWHRIVSTSIIGVLVLLGFLYWPWWLWAGVAFFLLRRHPLVYDRSPLSRGRIVLAVAALLIFVLSLSIVPVRTL
ncbi:MAG TPA: site-2 protease family protein [Bryobacteraceae bacterium]|nr:site-2 protease family protein [Bryobacteraceae bacterium]